MEPEDGFSSFLGTHCQAQPASSQLIPSSPPASLHNASISKPRKPPPITPKRFNKFFTPRTSRRKTKSPLSWKSGRQLRDITESGANSRNKRRERDTSKPILFEDIENGQRGFQTPKCKASKKRKGLPSPESSPLQSSPIKRPRSQKLPQFDEVSNDEEEHEFTSSPPNEEQRPIFPSSIRRPRLTGVTSRLLQRSFGQHCGSNGTDHCTDWRFQTADFYTKHEDLHALPHSALPFCTASCNTNSLVVVGHEEGEIRLLETAKDGKPPFSTAHLTMRPHDNAVMDLTFSSDDKLLATASGDQTAHVIDMFSQQTRYVLAGHASSVKQIRFQPGNDNIIATSSRDGTVRLWDLRCSAPERLVQNIHVSLGSDSAPDESTLAQTVAYASVFNTIPEAHSHRKPLGTSQNAGNALSLQRNTSTKPFTPERSSDVSITAISFLSQAKDHLLLTASEASACIKLWDIRGKYTKRRAGPAVPLSTTRQPDSHNKHRHFGINSLTLSGDGSRLYALCRDSTIYAYSTNHLVLGAAPELSAPAGRRQRYATTATTTDTSPPGLGPVYGFRHPQFHVSSFYVKAALRPAAGDRPEMLAVGSSDGCPVLFPTDERALLLRQKERRLRHHDHDNADNDELDSHHRHHHPPTTLFPTPLSHPSHPSRPINNLTRTTSTTSLLSTTSLSSSPRTDDTNIPISTDGTPLVRGHGKEVTGLTWTVAGELVSVSDDFSVRCWREGRAEARDLRVGGEAEGRRWRCGWAEVEGDWDEGDED